jgi:HK97 family phage prohead protease
VFSGYAAVFNSPSEPLPFTETIAPGAFRRTLKSDREIRMFVNHDMGQILATTRNNSLRLVEDARGLRAEADLPDTTAGRDLATLIESGVVHSMSFGFSIPRGGDSFSDNGQTREIREAILHEVSVITGWPAYKATSGVTVRNTEEIAVEEAADRGLPVALAQRIFDLNSKR